MPLLQATTYFECGRKGYLPGWGPYKTLPSNSPLPSTKTLPSFKVFLSSLNSQPPSSNTLPSIRTLPSGNTTQSTLTLPSMAFAAVNHTDNTASAPAPALARMADEPSKPKFKSYKKKYQKMRHKFKNSMRENTRLYDEEQHNIKLSRRLQEQNDQMLDVLLDVNESTKVPPHLRYDLRSPTPNASDVPALEPDLNSYETSEVAGARAALVEIRSELDGGRISLSEYREHEAPFVAIINAPHALNAPKTLGNLSRVSHTRLSSVPIAGMPADLVEATPTGYLNPVHEEEYLSNLDNFLATIPPDSQPILPRQPRSTDKEREKDAQLHNPVSVYNWLRMHDDKLSSHHNEKEAPIPNTNALDLLNHKAKPSPKPPSSVGTGSTKPSRKRASSAIMPKQEPEEEVIDEEGYVIAGGSEAPATKGKRKRENDDAYRPKGGSSKARKRTKGSSGAAAKKPDMDVDVEMEEEDA